jgi:carbon starvation protein
MVILFCSMRRNGMSLGQMVKEELNTAAGTIAMLAILAIMIILLAVLALVVVKALADSPWGIFTVGATIPIALLMGTYLRFWRVGKVMEASIIGVVLLLLAVWGGKFFHTDPTLAKALKLDQMTLAWSIIIYGLAASILPVWLLLAPRDYLSTFMKLGTIAALALGIFLVLPGLKLAAVTQFVNGGGPVVAGKLFPFCFITIACGAISGFHTLISSGTTPKIITRESYSRPIGYGAMCLESLVAIMALIAACTLDPGVYFSINIKGEAAATVAKVTALNYPVTEAHMQELAHNLGESTLFGRTGGAATLAVGMAQIFSKVVNGRFLDLWYHFAIMFEALFILTTLDAGTRVGRYLLQDFLGHVWKPLGDTKRLSAACLASALVVAAWGKFLIQGVKDPLGGINSLWPLFGIANQLLAAIALCLATTVILKMQLQPDKKGRPAIALITLIPLTWLLAVTLTAGAQKMFHPDPTIGFQAAARVTDSKLPTLQETVDLAKKSGDAKAIESATKALQENRSLHFNWILNEVVTGIFLVMVVSIALLSVREWILLLAKQKIAQLKETLPVWLPDYAIAEARPMHVLSVIALGFALVKELSGEAAVERAQKQCPHHAYVHATEKRFDGINRCC